MRGRAFVQGASLLRGYSLYIFSFFLVVIVTRGLRDCTKDRKGLLPIDDLGWDGHFGRFGLHFRL